MTPPMPPTPSPCSRLPPAPPPALPLQPAAGSVPGSGATSCQALLFGGGGLLAPPLGHPHWPPSLMGSLLCLPIGCQGKEGEGLGRQPPPGWYPLPPTHLGMLLPGATSRL